jgi:hypothetical protein
MARLRRMASARDTLWEAMARLGSSSQLRLVSVCLGGVVE